MDMKVYIVIAVIALLAVVAFFITRKLVGKIIGSRFLAVLLAVIASCGVLWGFFGEDIKSYSYYAHYKNSYGDRMIQKTHHKQDFADFRRFSMQGANRKITDPARIKEILSTAKETNSVYTVEVTPGMTMVSYTYPVPKNGYTMYETRIYNLRNDRLVYQRTDINVPCGWLLKKFGPEGENCAYSTLAVQK